MTIFNPARGAELSPASEQMRCMEVWGGNAKVAKQFEMPGLRLWVYCRPHDGELTGGDVYYVSSCASGRITRMLLADVSGHGALVSKVAIGLRDLMRRNINAIKQTRFVQAMNEQFTEIAPNSEFASALVATFFAPTRSFSLCNAGHPPPIMYRKRTREWSQLQEDVSREDGIQNLPLGIVDRVEYAAFDTMLDDGDLVLCLSDGVTESDDQEGRALGYSGLVERIRGLEGEKPEQVIPRLTELLISENPKNLTQDDVTILLCQSTGTAPSLKDNLMAVFRLFGPVRDNTHLS